MANDCVCKICGKNFSAYASLRNHMICHRKKNYACKFCDKIFKKIQNLQLHIQEHAKSKGIVCKICDEFFPTEDLYKEHNLNLHNFKCSLCSKLFEKEEYLIEHEKNHPTVTYGKMRKRIRHGKYF